MGLFTKKSFVGIDLGSHTLKAVQTERAGAGYKISRVATAPTPADSIRDGVVTDPEAIGAALRELMRSGGITATDAHIAAAGASVFVRVVPFPKMTEAVLRKSIKYEASRYVPGSVEDSYIEFEILGPINESQMSVLIVAAPKDIVESRLRACEKAGLTVDSVDIEVFSSYRILLETAPGHAAEDMTVLIVDIGASSTSVSVVHRGLFAMNRSIPNGGKAITDELKRKFGLTDDDAEAGKSQLDVRGLLPNSGIEHTPPLRIIQPHVEDLLREIRRSINYFQSQQTDATEGRKIERIVLSGGGAKLPGLDDYLAQRLEVPVETAGIYSNSRVLPPNSNADVGLDLVVAGGLSLRSYMKAG